MAFDRDKLRTLVEKSTMTTGDLGDTPAYGRGLTHAQVRRLVEQGKIRVYPAVSRRQKKGWPKSTPISKQQQLVNKLLLGNEAYESAPFMKANDELRYSLGVFYAPHTVDLHGEWASDNELHKAVIGYQMRGDRRLKLQHNPNKEVGTVIGILRWPYEHEAEITNPNTLQKRKVTLPAGTIYAEVIWDPEFWPLVKAGRIRGFSMGGRAMRVRVDPVK